jgi:hypothetical protein
VSERERGREGGREGGWVGGWERERGREREASLLQSDIGEIKVEANDRAF